MFKFFLKKKKLIDFKIIILKSFELTPDKIASSPRDFSTQDVKIAIEDIEIEPKEIKYKQFIKIASFILKDLFFSFHQTGLYNRQLKLWKPIGNITQIELSILEQAMPKYKDLNIYILDFFVDKNNVSFRAIISNEPSINFDGLKKLIRLCLTERDLKGVMLIIPEKEIADIKMSESHLNIKDYFDLYESMIPKTKDTRLNVISCEQQEEDYYFKHVFPYIENLKKENICKNLK